MDTGGSKVPEDSIGNLWFTRIFPYELEVEEPPRQREHQEEWKQHEII